MSSLDGCRVVHISREQAASVIMEYEWLGTMPSVGLAYFGLITPDGEIAGVVCFGAGGGTNSHNVCGEKFKHLTVCLERGACTHWCHEHGGSFLVSAACKLASRLFGWKVFYAYSDEEAGEIGTIYQACNWTYIGRGVGRGNGNTSRSVFTDPAGNTVSSRAMRRRYAGKTLADVWPEYEALGWKRRRVMDKHKYVLVLAKGKERQEMVSRLPSLPYPKRKQNT
jgi:hypothetical protein